ncbi:MAG: UDP-N-acetylmuramoyl-L-alanine--D-glutamate ligase [Fidelibacterota bacterium]
MNPWLNTPRPHLKDKRVTVLGGARSGMAACRLLTKVGATIFLSDQREPGKWVDKRKELSRLGIESEINGHSEKSLEADLIIVSPGVPQDAEILTQAGERGIPIVSEVELASWFTTLPIAAITGSNGKTTTTTILAEMSRHGGYKTFLAGNIGFPFSDAVLTTLDDEPTNGLFVLEISSFQMEHILYFKPYIAILLNLTPDHLDRYPDFDTYASAKMNILKNMTEENWVVYNEDDSGLLPYLQTQAQKVPFSLSRSPKTLFTLNETKIYDEKNEIVVYLKDISIPGKHNLYNFLAAATASRLLEINSNQIGEVITSFPGVEHRIEFVKDIDGIVFYNDSKATNVDSVAVALQAFDRPIILIMGGLDKGGDFSLLVPLIKSSVKAIILVGAAADLIAEVYSGVVPLQNAVTIQNAVEMAWQSAQPGDVVLLSPGCASFDQFDNYEERGKVFKKTVNDLKRIVT